ncbi:MAG: hypothetical protein ASARMPREDX12_002387 [Alectoria sarmentosa]|nr:MAG: hypothetical protein ASARMPREDX12_002387 [Alectoria sarmentosa]
MTTIVIKTDSTNNPASNRPGVLRGPPRKPRQSGHALWVGNLPRSTDIMKLKEHFSAAATATIESVFWISKSNSAFVNYRTEEALSDAQNRFHNSKFEEVRLVCRVRKTGIPAPIAGSTALRPGDDKGRAHSVAVEDSVGSTESERNSSSLSGLPRGSETDSKASPVNHAKKRFFIMKSLATEDLESSVRDGQWVTQQHNETALNEAFECAEGVFLFFSANKSGEYFGYARMSGLIKGLSPRPRPTRPAEDALKTCGSNMPEMFFTPGTECAPEGAIFIDAYRDTIFWEADIASQDTSSPKLVSGAHEARVGGEGVDPAKDQEWDLSSPFKVEWMSTNRLPFYRTRGLRNSWNGNRDVKVARDGTELETDVGIRLLELFHQPMMPLLWDSNGYSPVGLQSLSPAQQYVWPF